MKKSIIISICSVLLVIAAGIYSHVDANAVTRTKVEHNERGIECVQNTLREIKNNQIKIMIRLGIEQD